MSSRPVLIHPGYHKTGTTFLQNVLFREESGFAQPWSRAFIDRHILKPHPFAFDADAVRAEIARAAAGVPAGLVRVMSEEGLSGNPFTGSRESTSLADKLARLFDAPKVLVTIRRQQQIIPSLYIQYLKTGGRLSLDDFLEGAAATEFSRFDPGVFDYDRLVGYYAGLFGAANVLVLPQEYLKREPVAAIALIGRHVGIDNLAPPKQGEDASRDNISPPGSSIPFLRAGNYFAAGPFNETGTVPGRGLARVLRSIGYGQRLMFRNRDAKVKRMIAGRFAGRYADSNRRLQAMTPVALGPLGYDF